MFTDGLQTVFNKIDRDFTALICGKRQSGKDTLIRYIYGIINQRFRNVIIFDNVGSLNMLGKKSYDITRENLQIAMAFCKEQARAKAPLHNTLIILNDFYQYNDCRREIDELFMCSRNYRTSVLVSCSYLNFPPLVRANTDLYFQFYEHQQSIIDRVYKYFGAYNTDTNRFNNIVRSLKPGECFLVNFIHRSHLPAEHLAKIPQIDTVPHDELYNLYRQPVVKHDISKIELVSKINAIINSLVDLRNSLK